MSSNKGSDLIGGQELNAVFQEDANAGHLWQRTINAINSLGRQFGIAPRGKLSPPPPIGSVAVKVSGDMMHVQIQDYAEIQKGIHYFTEVDTNPSFTKPIVIAHGPSRCPAPFPLPTNNDAGDTPQTYYVRSYSQYPGSDPSAPVLYGGKSPVAVQMSGFTNLTLLSSTGSGTAAGTGQQGGQGFGKPLVRLPANRPANSDLVFGNPTPAHPGVVTNISTSAPITGGPITGTGTIGILKATNTNFGAVQVDGTTITSVAGVISATVGTVGVTAVTGTAPITSTGGTTPDIAVNVATVGTVGVVMPDGTSITIDPDGTIHATGGSGPVFEDNETPSGATGTAFTLAFTPSPSASLQLFQQISGFGGILLVVGTDYTITGANITTTNTIPSGTLRAWYRH